MNPTNQVKLAPSITHQEVKELSAAFSNRMELAMRAAKTPGFKTPGTPDPLKVLQVEAETVIKKVHQMIATLMPTLQKSTEQGKALPEEVSDMIDLALRALSALEDTKSAVAAPKANAVPLRPSKVAGQHLPPTLR